MRKRKSNPVTLERLLKTAPESHRLTLMEVRALNSIQKQYKVQIKFMMDCVQWKNKNKITQAMLEQLVNGPCWG
jgi:hypothetical protein